MKREFYLQDDRSNKFWTIEVVGNGYVTTNGRMGAAPRETRKEFANEDQAQREADKLIAAKIKKGYVEGNLAAAPQYEKPDWASMTMSEDIFWRIIGLFDWKKLGDDDAVIAPAVSALSQMTVADIERFEDILAEKLYALDTEAHAREIGQEAYRPGKYFSADWFLYVRCCVVANGRDVFETIRANPADMPKDAEFESLSYLASAAHEKKTGAELDHLTPVSFETYSNLAGWGQ